MQKGGRGDLDWQRIAAHFDTLFTTEASIDALKQTLLQLAVMGKLVPQDPNDEPASELLKRIQAEKAKLVAEGKIKKEKSPLTPLLQRGESTSPTPAISNAPPFEKGGWGGFLREKNRLNYRRIGNGFGLVTFLKMFNMATQLQPTIQTGMC